MTNGKWTEYTEQIALIFIPLNRLESKSVRHNTKLSCQSTQGVLFEMQLSLILRSDFRHEFLRPHDHAESHCVTHPGII